MKLKKILAAILCIGVMLTGCTSNEKPNDNNVNDNSNNIEPEKFKIGITQIIQHPALDASRQGFVDELKNLGIEAEIFEQNAQGDVANAQIIAEKFVKDKVDLIFSIATPTSQAAKQAVMKTDIPVVFTAVTDPVYAELVEDRNITDKNITGVTDTAPVEAPAKDNLQLFFDLKDDVKSIGIIYNTGELNSQAQVEEAELYAKELGITIEKVGISSANDIPQAISTIAKKADGLYIITDNMVASAISTVANMALENKLPTVSADGTHVDEGIMMSNGISYYEIGRESAAIAKKILVDKVPVSEIPVQDSSKVEKIVNLNVAKELGFEKDNKAFEGANFLEQ